MSYFFSKESLWSGKEIEITGGEARHIGKSRRVKIGEIIELQDPENKRFKAEIASATKDKITAKIILEIKISDEQKISISLFQANIKKQAMDYILQKCTELGATNIFFFNSQFSSERLDEKIAEKRFPRWEKIAVEAMKQSGRATMPQIKFLKNQENISAEFEKCDAIFLADFSGEKNLLEHLENKSAKNIGLIIGPEGGFSEKELKTFKNMQNLRIAKLAKNTLRADTAAILAVGVVSLFFNK
jgi:16S rRNA (uracil1498-N3)-methyltransferase